MCMMTCFFPINLFLNITFLFWLISWWIFSLHVRFSLSLVSLSFFQYAHNYEFRILFLFSLCITAVIKIFKAPTLETFYGPSFTSTISNMLLWRDWRRLIATLQTQNRQFPNHQNNSHFKHSRITSFILINNIVPR